MKKKLKFFASSLIVVCVLLSAFAFGCSSGRKLDVPDNIEINLDNYVLSWSRVDNASGYEVKVESADGTYSDTYSVGRTKISYSLEALEENDYNVWVRAKGTSSGKYRDSKWSDVLAFSKDYYSGCVYTLINNGTAYEITGWSKPSGGETEIEIYAEYRDKPVLGIADRAFQSKPIEAVTVYGDNLTYVGDNAFYSCSSLKSVVLPDSVTSIGAGAFHSCKLMTEFRMPAGVTEIQSSTFLYCRSLEKIDFGNVTSIGDSAFYGCNQALTSVKIPDEITSIGDRAFGLCSLLESVEIGSGCETIGEYAFQNDAALRSVEFRKGEGTDKSAVTEIGDYAFTSCTALESVAIPQGVETIGEYAFSGASSLEKVNIPETVTKIGRDAFTGTKLCDDQSGDLFVYAGKSLPSDLSEGEKEKNKLWILMCNEDVAESEGVTEIDMSRFDSETVGIADRAFSETKALEEVDIPEYIQYVGERSFYKSSFTTVKFQGSKDSEPSKQTPVYIGSYAFAQMKKLNTVQFNDTSTPASTTYPAIKSIGDYAFYNSPYVSDGFNISASLEHVGAYAFNKTSVVDGDYGVKYIGTSSGSTAKWVVGYTYDELGDADEVSVELETQTTQQPGTTGIADYAFKAAILVDEIRNLNTVTYVGEGAFYQCESLTAAALSRSVTEIKDYTFYGCRSLERVGSLYESSYPNLTYIGKSAFYNCESFAQINLSDTNLEYIGKYAFYGCSSLTDILFDDDLCEIDDYAFYKSGLISVELPSSLERIGKKAFYKSTNLEEVVIDSDEGAELEIDDYAFYKCSALGEITLPGRVKSVGNYAFYKCDALTSLTMKKGVEKIGEGAFAYVPITSLNIPSSVTEIGKYAFRGCTHLKSVIIPSTVETIGDYAFYGLTKATFYTDADGILPKWSTRLNASNRPMIWGCEISEGESSYVVSVEITNDTFTDVIRIEETADSESYSRLCTAPEREGYEFLGWATSPGGEVAYFAEDIDKAPVGTVLYSVWKEDESDAGGEIKANPEEEVIE